MNRCGNECLLPWAGPGTLHADDQLWWAFRRSAQRVAEDPPEPRTAPASDTAVTYLRQKGHWYQFRMKLEEKGPTTAKDELIKLDVPVNR